MNKILSYFTFALLILILVCSPAKAEEMTPGQFVVDKIEESLKILHDPELQDFDRLVERQQKLWELLGPVFNFREISRRSLGIHWKNITPEQRNEFTDLFTRVLKNLYLGKSDAYAGEEIVYIREVSQGKRSKVQTNFITLDGKKIAVDFSLKSNPSTWQIYDIHVEGISIVSNYRRQFNSILSKSTFEDLIDQLKEKEGISSEM